MRRTMFQCLSSLRTGSFGPVPARWLAIGLAGALTLPLAAQAQQAPAYTNGPTIMRAGPSQQYPEVARVQPGVPVSVMGCLQNYSWCDVGLPGARGWVHASRLNYPYQGSSVPLSNYGMAIGVPIVSFAIGPYWDEFYRGRPWFNDRDRWAHRGPPPFEGGPGPGPGWGGHPQPGYGPDRGGFHGGPGGPGGPGNPGGQPHGGGPGGERFHEGGPGGGDHGRGGGHPGGDGGHHGGDDHGHGGPGG
ncbi:SH3 domain-containing protein [Robbsia sp. Bb-Pol-6]|uniref:SH3 domain-containing protein n=1 Tax=Robbsia betulipollinis TaxID=2981849 RepID=A0ABT3ZGT1_9BURK|nr:SH3 domain-containing protein [Robbsia betulipollinis]MCY0385733.1 SH3 domain-containing protein [Robbsia betulipollinis]